jgi:hypothetical protein
MKHSKMIFTIIVFAIISGCAKGPDDLLLSIRKDMCDSGSLDPMVKHAAPESAALLGTLQVMMAEPGKREGIKADIEKNCAAEGNPEVISTEIDGDSALVVVKYANGKTEESKLRKVDGEWKLVIEK